MKKILMLSWSDLYGGAARACYQTYLSIKKDNKNIELFVQKKISKDKNIQTYKRSTVNLLFRKYFSLIMYKLRFSIHDYSYNLINSDIINKSNIKNYDVVNLHWVNSETLSIKDIKKINKKIVMTLHDMWAFCGSEHYLYNLPKKYFRNGNEKKINLLDYLIWKKKRKLWKKKFNIVAPTMWMANLVKRSHLMKDFPVTVIPYSVNRGTYCKKKVNNIKINNITLKKNKEFIDILFISAGKLFNYRKGFDLLDNAVNQYKNKKKIRIILAGKFNEADKIQIKSNYIMLGEIKSDRVKAQLYNFVDMLALPSRLDNLPNVGLEAHSCGTPIVGFKVGGIPEIVVHKKTGYLVSPFSLNSFIKGINFVIENQKLLSKNSVKKSKIWSPKIISRKYNNLFKTI
jgi:glycosyltransferase involved in cell wall biosynthesis